MPQVQAVTTQAPSIVALLREQLQETVSACRLTSLTAADIEQIARHNLLQVITDPVTGFLNGTCRVEMLRRAQRWAEQTGRPVWYVEFDVRNVGGGNAKLGHQRCNEKILQPLARKVAATVTLMTADEDRWSLLFRHGGDEYSAIIGGVPNDPDAGRELTRNLDTLVREAHAYSVAEGLDLLPHPKHPLRFSRWGTGLSYGFAPVLPGRDLATIFSDADQRVERYKRGLEPGAVYPLSLSWRKRMQMLGILLGIR